MVLKTKNVQTDFVPGDHENMDIENLENICDSLNPTSTKWPVYSQLTKFFKCFQWSHALRSHRSFDQNEPEAQPHSKWIQRLIWTESQGVTPNFHNRQQIQMRLHQGDPRGAYF